MICCRSVIPCSETLDPLEDIKRKDKKAVSHHISAKQEISLLFSAENVVAISFSTACTKKCH